MSIYEIVVASIDIAVYQWLPLVYHGWSTVIAEFCLRQVPGMGLGVFSVPRDLQHLPHWDAPYKIDILQYDELETPTNRSVYHILDALYKIEILQYELETLNQLVPIGLAITSR